jgi:hypothetical protein
MTDAAYMRSKAQQCRELSEMAIMPDVREQLDLFAHDYEAHAEALDRLELADATED